tara:strand:+ start:317 stop:532 length:216 start_codon:yes stop_codon:yes gene_type:complete
VRIGKNKYGDYKVKFRKYCEYRNSLQQICKNCDCWKMKVVLRAKEKAKAKQKLTYKIKKWFKKLFKTKKGE